MINLKQIIPALDSVGASTNHLHAAINELNVLLTELDGVEVKGRDNVDTLLGCMMAVEAIIGKEGGDNSGQANL